MGNANLFGDEKFGEDLPGQADQCPPAEASNSALEAVFRLIPIDAPTDETFKSFAALGEERPGSVNATDCEWASCSLRTDIEMLLKMKGLRRRNPFVATLSIPAGSGRHTIGGTHVNFWRHHDFSIAGAVVKVHAHDLP